MPIPGFTARLAGFQGVRLGDSPTGLALPKPSSALNVEAGCSVPNACDASPCPANSICSDEWQSYSCTCQPGRALPASCPPPLHSYPLHVLSIPLFTPFPCACLVSSLLSAVFGALHSTREAPDMSHNLGSLHENPCERPGLPGSAESPHPMTHLHQLQPLLASPVVAITSF